MKRIPQHEFSFNSEPFALVAQSTQDGAGIVAEREQAQRDRAQSAALQSAFVGELEREQGCPDCGASGPSCDCKAIEQATFTPTKCKRCRTAIKPGTDFCSPQCERVCADIADRAHVATQEWKEIGRALAMAEREKLPGLAPGSFWTVEGKGTLSDPTMLKALATMQVGR